MTDIKRDYEIVLNGSKKNLTKKDLYDQIKDKIISGSVKFNESTFLFSCVEPDIVDYIFDSFLAKNNKEVQIEIQTNDGDATQIQHSSFGL